MFREKFTIPLVVLVAISVMLIATDYRARENDSRLYTREVVDLSSGPISKIIAPKWNKLQNSWQFDRSIPYIQDHPMGNLVPGLVLAKIGIPPTAALYIANIVYKIAIVLLLYLVALNFFDEKKASFVLFSGQLILGSITYQIRSNHEQLLLLSVVLLLYSLLQPPKNLYRYLGVALSFAILLLTKGVFVLLGIFVLVAYFMTFKDSIKERLIILMTGVIPLLFVVLIYEFWYRRVTGISFIEGYWKIQIAIRTLNESDPTLVGKLIHKLQNLSYYSSRTLMASLPWSFLLIGVALYSRKRVRVYSLYSELLRDRFTKLFSLFIIIQILFFSLSDRLAARYLFQSFILSGVLFSYHCYDRIAWIRSWYQKLFYPNKFVNAFLTLLLFTSLSLVVHLIQFPLQIWH